MTGTHTAGIRTADLTAACDCLDRARSALDHAVAQTEVNGRFVYAHMAALRVAAAVLAVRARPRVARAPRSAWAVLTAVAPELGEWADYFAATASRRPVAAASASPVVTSREADDLVRAVGQFAQVAERRLGLSPPVAQ